MYLSESNGRCGTHGFASADQFSCQRLNMHSRPRAEVLAAADVQAATGSSVLARALLLDTSAKAGNENSKVRNRVHTCELPGPHTRHGVSVT